MCSVWGWEIGRLVGIGVFFVSGVIVCWLFVVVVLMRVEVVFWGMVCWCLVVVLNSVV